MQVQCARAGALHGSAEVCSRGGAPNCFSLLSSLLSSFLETQHWFYKGEGDVADTSVYGQFKVPAQTSAIITNGALIGTEASAAFVALEKH